MPHDQNVCTLKQPANRELHASRGALLKAFAQLALSRSYREFGVGQIVGIANVARSTFYYHFRQKDDLLLQNLQPVIAILARLHACPMPPPELEDWTSHIWQHRAKAARIFDSPADRKIADMLVREMLAEAESSGSRQSVPQIKPLLAEQIANSQMGLLRAWVQGRGTATCAEISGMLWTGARALVRSGADSGGCNQKPKF